MLEHMQNLIGDLSRKLKANEINKRYVERCLLEVIGDEFDRSELDRASWLRAYSESEGDNDKAKSLYIKHRLQALLDEITTLQHAQKEKGQSANSRTTNSVQKNAPKPSREKETRNKDIDDDKRNKFIGAFLLIFFIIIIALVVILSKENTSTYSYSDSQETNYAQSDYSVEQPSAASTLSSDGNLAPGQGIFMLAGLKLAENFFQIGSQNDQSKIFQLYGDYANYYGEMRSDEFILDEKIKYITRWPIRTYDLDRSTVVSNCSDIHHCIVSGEVAWSAASPIGNRAASGRAEFRLEFTNGLVTSEYSKVISRN